MKIFTILRTILGFLYVVYGIDGFLNFIPGISLPGIKAETFYAALVSSGYVLPMLHISAIVCGVSLLTNIFPAFFLLLLFPFMANFSLFFFFLGNQVLLSSEMFIPLAVSLAHIILILSHFRKYRELFKFH